MTLPIDLAGYQHLAPDQRCRDDDILVCNGTPRSFCGDWAGSFVEEVEAQEGARIYRRLRVAKQSDAHEREFAAARALLSPSSVAELFKRDAELMKNAMAADAKARKATPIYSGFLKYFPLACAEVARVSRAGNDQHNPGKPLHWDRSKSGDELDALARHLLEAGTFDTDGQRHSAKLAWRSMANLEKELEAAKDE